MAVTFVDTSKGKWQFTTDGGTNWLDIPAVAETSALLLADKPTTRVRFLPKGLFQGFSSLSFKAWDQTNLAPEGSRDDASTAAGDESYSTATERAWVAVGKTTPKVDTAGHPLLAPVKEDRKASAALTVKSFLGLLAREVGVTSTSGIALSAADQTDGKWQFNLGRGWVDLGTVSDTSALLLRPTDRLRFMPNHDFDGQATLTYHTWVPVKGLEGTRAAATGTGFSAATETAIEDVVAINDAPVLDLSRAVTLDPVTVVGQPTPAVTFASLLAATDVDSPTIGVAITKAVGQGTWEYSRNGGGTWSQVGAVPLGKAILLNAMDMVRFTAASNATAGSAALSYRAWDQFNQFPGTAGQTVPIRGTAFSKETEVLTVALLNTEPTLDTSGAPTLPTVRNTARPGSGALVGSLGITDSNSKAVKGIAITVADNANGKWQFLLGGKWLDVGTVSNDSALLLSSTSRLRFVPNATFTGQATIQFKAWDQTAGQVGDRIDTDSGLNSFSTAVETASITVTA